MRLIPAFLGLAACLCVQPAVAQPQFRCIELIGLTIKPASISMPTKGALVTAAKLTAPPTQDDTAPRSKTEYCLVSGKILPIDPTAQSIQFQLAMPRNWNGKAAMLGGGGFNGVIPKITENVSNAPDDALSPLQRGYAVFASDSGHQAASKEAASPVSPNAADFMANDEQYRNYLGDALKKTRDAAMVLIEMEYGKKPSSSYFFGASKGGTEGLVLAGRWPADWNGIVAQYPGRSLTAALMGQLTTTQALAVKGAYLSLPKRAALRKAALAACDKLDGLEDGIIADVQRCHAVFNPATALLEDQPLRCPDGEDAGDDCLSDAQINALNIAGSPTSLRALGDRKEPSFAGFNILTAGLGASSDSPSEPLVAHVTIGTTTPTFPPSEGNSLSSYFSDRFIKTAIAQNKEFNQFEFDVAKPGPFAERLRELTAMDSVETDLSAFRKRGGKLIIITGTDDMLSSPRQIETYVRDVQNKIGSSGARDTLRFYEIPAWGHGISTVFNARFDAVSMLENWAEKKIDPADAQVATDLSGVPGRTRPLCPYPAWPKYKGNGDADAASSFICARR